MTVDEPRPTRPVVLALILASLAGIFLADTFLPLGVNVAALYVLPVLLCLWSRRERLSLIVAAVATALTAAGWLLSPTGALGPALFNRSLNVAVIWVIAASMVYVSSRRRALRSQERRHQELLDLVGVTILATDRDGRVTLINRDGLTRFGVRAEDILGTRWTERFLSDTDRAGMDDLHRQLIAGDTGIVEESTLSVVGAGEPRVFLWRHAPIQDEAGAVTGSLSAGTDITRRVRAEEGLRQSLKELADLQYALDQSSIVAATNRQGIITYVNDKFCEISKYSRDQLIGHDHRIVNSGYHPKEFMRDLWRTISDGRLWHGEIRNRASDGSFYWVDTTIVPFLDDRGRPYQYMAIRNDITERKRTEQALREQEALARLGEMAAVVAHEVKNPLAGARGALQVIAGRLPAANEERRIIDDVVARLDALNEMVQDLLQFARPRAPQPTRVPIRLLLQDTIRLMAGDVRLAGLAIELEGPDMFVRADPDQLKSVLLNLLLNAAQATEGQGIVRVSIAAEDGYCVVRVADRGPGISAAVRERVFEPFFSTKHRGTGLGLAIARRLVELHGGTIELACPPEGGTTVRIRLPGSGPAAGGPEPLEGSERRESGGAVRRAD